MTTGKEWKVILLFTLPLMAGNFLQQLYNAVDGMVMGNFVGDTGLAAIGSCASLALIFVCLALGFSTGAGIVVAQLFGAQKMQDMRRAVSTSLILLLAMGLVFSILGFIFTPWLMGGLLNIQETQVREMAIVYFRIYCVGILFQFAYNAFAAMLRALGNSRATLYFLLVSTLVNIGLDLLFVAVFHWGAAGAAVATVIAQFLSALVGVIYTMKKYPVLRFTKGEFGFDRKMCGLALRFGIPMTIQQSCISIGTLAIQRLANGFGKVTMAAFTAGGRIEMFCCIPFTSFSTGLCTFVGQNVGAGKMDRVLRGHKGTMLISASASAAISVLVWLLAPTLAAAFGVEGAALAQAVEYIRFQAFFFILFSIYGTYTATIQGAGDVIYASFCTMTSFGVRGLAAYLFVYVFHMGYACCWNTIPIGWGFCTLVAAIRFYMGTWKKKAITTAEPGGDSPEKLEA